MKKIHVSAILLLLVVMSSCASLLADFRNSQLMGIQKGMTQQEVKTILGEPNYRRFDGGMEEWEYRGYLSKAGPSVICVNFIDNRVVGLDSFKDGAPTVPPAPSFSLGIGGTVSASEVGHSYSYRAMRNDEFARFLNDAKSKTFDSDRTDFIEKAASSTGFTSEQCRRLIKLYSFDDDRTKVLKILYQSVVDKDNFSIAVDELDFLSNRSTVKDFVKNYNRTK